MSNTNTQVLLFSLNSSHIIEKIAFYSIILLGELLGFLTKIGVCIDI